MTLHTLHTLPLAAPGRAPLDPERRLDVCAYIALIEAWIATPGPRAAQLTLATLVEGNRAMTGELGQALSITLFGITARAQQPATAEGLLRAWVTAAKDRLQSEAR